MKNALTLLLVIICWTSVLSQDMIEITKEDYSNNDVEMADTFRQSGKIYVVVGVTGIILVGLFVYTITLDRKISRLEKEIGRNNSKED